MRARGLAARARRANHRLMVVDVQDSSSIQAFRADSMATVVSHGVILDLTRRVSIFRACRRIRAIQPGVPRAAGSFAGYSGPESGAMVALFAVLGKVEANGLDFR